MEKFRIGSVVKTLVSKKNDGIAIEYVTIPKGTKGVICEIYQNGNYMVEINGFSKDIVLFDYAPNELELIEF